MVAVAEAAAVAGAPDLDAATSSQLAKAWDLVRKTADVTMEGLAKRIADQNNLPVADLPGADARATVLVPADVAHRRTVLPLRCTERDVAVATANPLSQVAKRDIAELTGRHVTFEVAAPEALVASIRTAYGEVEAAEIDIGTGRRETPLPGGPHVLVVDDEPGQRALFRSILEGAGYRVTVASDGREALGMLHEDVPFDLVTLDYWMDQMNGLRVLQQIRSQASTKGLPVIMVTGADDRRIEMSLFEAGADDYVAKPIDGPLFLLRIRAVLRRRRYA